VNNSAGFAKTNITRYSDSYGTETETDLLAVEEPLEIRLQLPGISKHKAISITMRTPGDDFDLAAGFLFTEGIITGAAQVSKIRYCGLPAAGKNIKNTLVAELAEGVDIDLKRLERHFYTSSSCGVCGKSSIEALHTGVKKVAGNGKFKSGMIHTLPGTLRGAQAVFERTGGLHASALFDAEGNLDILREDVGRHNALDKVIGAKFMSGETPLNDHVLLVSGRASFELVQKALMAGIPVLAAVGAPSSLAVELAGEFGMTLIGFVREQRFNIYTGAERIA
jgi:FdhD protein